MAIINRGVITPKIRESDYVAGQETGIKYQEIKSDADWSNYLPTDESQWINFETGGCTNWSELNALEIRCNFMVEKKQISDATIKKLKDWGFFDENGKLNFSDRFLYKMSGTTQNGNQVVNGWDAIRKYGLVPQSMWPNNVSTYEEFIKPIPFEIQTFAKNFLTLFDVNYEWIVTGQCDSPNLDWLEYHLKQAPLQVVHPVCIRDNNGTFQRCGSFLTQHATVLYKIDRQNNLLKDYDHYSPYKNDFAIDYPLLWVMKGIMTEKVAPQPPVITPFTHYYGIDLWYRTRSDEVLWLQKGLNRLGYKIPETGYFGDITKSAVNNFQWKYAVSNAIILLWNGGKYVGPSTRKKLNELLKN